MTNVNDLNVSKQTVLHSTAFIVALCSFAYELIYSELLTVMYGGTVTQYGLTIGLFFSSLGVGSYLATHLDDTRHENFFRAQVYLALVAPLGFLMILWLNVTTVPGFVPNAVLQVMARVPVVLIGILSGFELPLLLSMVNAEYGDTAPAPNWVDRITGRVDAISYRLLSALFHTSRDSEAYDTYSTVLAMDYLGGLGGSLVFVFVLYPQLGLIPSIFILALLNCVAALLFALRFSTESWGLFRGEDRVILTRERTTILVMCLVLTTLYAGIGLNHHAVDDELTEYYMEGVIEQEYPDDTIDAEITSQYTTKHQQVIQYNRTWVGDSENQLFATDSETCLRLDTAIQLCDSWIESYHHGLVDVPMTMYENSPETNVLLVGGGDWVAVDRLRKHNVTVDQVDLDGEFLENTKTNSFIQPHHNDAYEYERLTTYQQDIYRYLRESDEEYDLILLDLPGAKSDSVLHLYSTEFYSLLGSHLSEQGVVVSWGYSEYTYGEHTKAYMSTVREAGFEQLVEYHAYSDFNRDGSQQIGERFLILSPTDSRPEIGPDSGTAYVQNHSTQYRSLGWTPTPSYDGVEPNSIFHPNYDIIVNDRIRARQDEYQ